MLAGACRFLFLLLACLDSSLRTAQRSTIPPPGAIGRVEGNDVSVEGGSAATNGTATSAPSMFVVNGSVITVHSGQARMTLVGGGQIDICGPAKFTLLQSGPAVTLALNFGRMRVQLPAAAQLRIFTPTIVATPIDIGGAPRDFTVGLDLSDSLCVVATSGALRLEHQFTGEGLIVPQSGEFFLAAGKLLPVAGVAGSCQCVSLQARNSASPSQPLPRSPEMGLTSKPQLEPPPVPEVASNPPVLPQPEPPPPAEVQATPPAIQIRQLADANQLHPNAPAPANEVPDAPALSIPIYKVVMPPLTFSANATRSSRRTLHRHDPSRAHRACGTGMAVQRPRRSSSARAGLCARAEPKPLGAALFAEEEGRILGGPETRVRRRR